MEEHSSEYTAANDNCDLTPKYMCKLCSHLKSDNARVDVNRRTAKEFVKEL